MRSYGQFCALARALDVIGERWTLLIIRELFAGDSRYSDLREALPGIATNLLAQRLRDLQEHGVIEARQAPAPVRATVYRLTPRGRDLGPALQALVQWGAPLLTGRDRDEFRMHWMVLGLPALFHGADVSDLAPLEIIVRADGQVATLTVDAEGVSMDVGATPAPDAVTVAGTPEQVTAALTGAAPAGTTGAARVRGPREAVRRLRLLAGRAGGGDRGSRGQGILMA